MKLQEVQFQKRLTCPDIVRQRQNLRSSSQGDKGVLCPVQKSRDSLVELMSIGDSMSPWWGDIFESLVHSIKRCLRKILRQAKFSCDELFTALIEIEMVLNSGPLTYVSADDLDKPLTPHTCSWEGVS